MHNLDYIENIASMQSIQCRHHVRDRRLICVKAVVKITRRRTVRAMFSCANMQQC